MQLRYEDLLVDPSQEVARIFDFLDLPTSESVEEQFDTIDPTNTRKWQHAMNRETRHQITRLVGETLEKFGYPVEPETYEA
jgi:hypothetical protein